MNTTQAREIPIEKVLQNLGCEPTKCNETESWYLSPFRIEKTASFKLNRKINRWFDHGEQVGGNVIDFVIQKFGFNVTEALTYLEKFDTLFSFQKQISEIPIKESNTNQIEKIIPIQHFALLQYLESRRIKFYKNIEQLKEVHYIINDKKYFGIGFQNNSQGWEIRSKYAKICLKKKDITLIRNGSQILRVYEGFFDYLSFQQIWHNLPMEESDSLILNSVALLEKNTSILQNYKIIELFLDNDEAGDKYTKLISTQFPGAKDGRITYSECKDLNEFLDKKNMSKRIEISKISQSKCL
ncbi:toprim domain-containing protein [Flavobacterium algoritolerans]|uniref:Toprim domain-containing protein n=1 Tax=Flavobacterium algoritolerans TaxID=3041254 RepID=A0ABT6VA91_9FLAO|nr:toprim domain-containing protein [Flavobacterium algoritolerans]MDI5893902.1 toprim domain-containing protein [Flavobacterium algoritolerans]